MHDKLVCRESAYQTTSTCITKELHASSKRIWPTFSVHIGPYTLSGVIHAKIKAMALEDINLSCIELKRHNPLKILDQHCVLVGVKRYTHEESLHDNIFRRAMYYQ